MVVEVIARTVVVAIDVARRLVLGHQRKHMLDDLVGGAVLTLRVDREVADDPQVVSRRGLERLLEPLELRAQVRLHRVRLVLVDHAGHVVLVSHAGDRDGVDHDDLRRHVVDRVRLGVPKVIVLPPARVLRVRDLRGHVAAVVVVACDRVEGGVELRIRDVEDVLKCVAEAR